MKGFADDLTVISPNKEQHKITLAVVVRKCKDLGLQIRADKCVSMVFNGHSMVDSTFDVGDGVTKNIREQPTKFLGCVVASSPKASKTHAGNSSLKISRKSFRILTIIKYEESINYGFINDTSLRPFVPSCQLTHPCYIYL